MIHCGHADNHKPRRCQNCGMLPLYSSAFLSQSQKGEFRLTAPSLKPTIYNSGCASCFRGLAANPNRVRFTQVIPHRSPILPATRDFTLSICHPNIHIPSTRTLTNCAVLSSFILGVPLVRAYSVVDTMLKTRDGPVWLSFIPIWEEIGLSFFLSPYRSENEKMERLLRDGESH